MEIKLRPFGTPNFVILDLPPGKREDGFRSDDRSIPLRDVPAEDLDKLCNAFRAEVFRKAGKTDPAPMVGAQPSPGGETGTCSA